jgi:hypothetical protein
MTGDIAGLPLGDTLYPTPGAAQPKSGSACVWPCSSAFVAKVQAGTGNLVYATYLGGDTNAIGSGIAVDMAGNAYVTGTTGSGFPTTAKAFLTTAYTGVFVAKLNPAGTQFLYSTYLPEAVSNPGWVAGAPAIAIDAQGNAYVTGQNGAGHAFVAKLSADGSALLYNTPLAGSGVDAGTSIAVDAEGNAYVAGTTSSPNFPVSKGAFQTGSFRDQGLAVQVDSDGYVYAAGLTTSMNFPVTAGSYEPTPLVPMWGTSPGGFATKLSPAGDALVYSTYVYGDAAYAVTKMITGSAGGVYLAGGSGPGMPGTSTAPQPCIQSYDSIVATHLDQHGALVDRTYYGTIQDEPLGMALVGDGSVLLGVLSGSALVEINFGDSQTPAAPCLSPMTLNGATFYFALAVSWIVLRCARAAANVCAMVGRPPRRNCSYASLSAFISPSCRCSLRLLACCQTSCNRSTAWLHCAVD